MLSTLKEATKTALAEIDEEKRVRKTDEVFILFSLGSQFDHLIKQEIEKLGVFCLVADPSKVTVEDIKKVNPKGIILSGGPVSVHKDAPEFDERIFDLKIPILGICLGFQLWVHHITGGGIATGEKSEFGTHTLTVEDFTSPLFGGCDKKMPVLESHTDIVKTDGKIRVLASTENCPVAAGVYYHLFGVQFHPEVTETIFGPQIFKNFIFEICGAKDRYPAEKEAERKILALKKQIGKKKVLLALSGGSDSSTCAYLLRSLGVPKDQIHAIYIKGVDRPDDEKFVLDYFGNQDWLTLHIVDATDRFLEALRGKLTMKEKRIAMRAVYKPVIEEKAREIGATFIVQGTLYTDISESGGGYGTGAQKAQIKLHHNVNLGFYLEEIMPLSDCVKDSGRNIGRAIGTPEELLTRHPFPGPGVVVRIEGEITAVKLAIARKVDEIYIEELRKWKLYDTVWQAGAVVTQSVTTCTKGDDAKSGLIIALWAVWSVNGFTARRARLSDDFLDHVSQRITNKVKEVGGVVYRISNKPPTTIEWG